MTNGVLAPLLERLEYCAVAAIANGDQRTTFSDAFFGGLLANVGEIGLASIERMMSAKGIRCEFDDGGLTLIPKVILRTK